MVAILLRLWKSFEDFFFHQWVGLVVLLLSIVVSYEMNMRGIHLILIVTDTVVLLCLFHISALREQPLLVRVLGTFIIGIIFSWITYFAFWNYNPTSDTGGPCMWLTGVTLVNLDDRENSLEIDYGIHNTSKMAQRLEVWAVSFVGTAPPVNLPPASAVAGTGMTFLGGDGTVTGAIRLPQLEQSKGDIKAGTKTLYFYGFIIYKDAVSSGSSSIYKCNFCTYFDPAAKTFHTTGSGNSMEIISSAASSSIPDKSAFQP